MFVQRQTQPRKSKGGFTLVELLLTVGIIMLLAGAVVFNFGSLDRGARLDESANLVDSLFRYARAQASSRGREVVVVFGDAPTSGSESSSSSGTSSSTSSPGTSSSASTSTNSAAGSASAPIPAGVQVLWEPDPIGAPGKLELLPGAYSMTEQLNELIRVHEVRPPGSDGEQTQATATKNADSGLSGEGAGSAGVSAGSTLRPVKFFPDGSSDSVEVVLGTLDDQDARRLLVSLSGTTGTLRHRAFSLGPDGEPAAPAAPGAEGSPGTQP